MSDTVSRGAARRPCLEPLARTSPDPPVVLKRGANGIQPCHEHRRWWAFGTIWDNEREGVAFELWRGASPHIAIRHPCNAVQARMERCTTGNAPIRPQ